MLWKVLGQQCRALAHKNCSGRRHGVWVKTHCWQRSMYALEELVRWQAQAGEVRFDVCSILGTRGSQSLANPLCGHFWKNHDFSHKRLKTRITHEYCAQCYDNGHEQGDRRRSHATERSARRILDMQRAFLGRRVYQPQHVEAASGRDSARFRRMTRVLKRASEGNRSPNAWDDSEISRAAIAGSRASVLMDK